MPKGRTGNRKSMLHTGAKAVGETMGRMTRMAEGLIDTGANAVGLGQKQPHATADERTSGRATTGRAAARKSTGGAKGRKASAKDTGGRTRSAAGKKTTSRTRGRKTTGRKNAATKR